MMDMRAMLATANAIEEQVVIVTGGQQIHGTLHLPPEERQPAPVVLVAHGFTGSRNADARLLVWICRVLAHNSIAALSIDFRGSGESEGDFGEMTPETEISDARVALSFLENDPRIDGTRMGMVGHSLGGLVTACTSGEDTRLKSIALWCAVANGAFIAERLYRAEEEGLCGHNGYDAGGLLVGRKFFECGTTIDVQGRFAKRDIPALIVRGTEDSVVPLSHAEEFVATAKKQGREHRYLPIEGAGHGYNSIAQRELLMKETLAWFCQTL